MKIYYITTGLDQYKGGGEVLLGIINALKARHKITVYTAETNVKNPDFDLRVLPMREWPYYYGLFDYFFAKKVIAEILMKKEKFDLIHINQVVGTPLLGLKNLDIPVIYEIHHPATADLEAALDFEQNPLNRIVWRLKYLPIIYAQKMLAKKFPVLTVSCASAEKISADYGIAQQDISVIYNAIDTEIFKPSAPKEPNTVIAVGSFIHPRKGFDYLLKIYEDLNKRGVKILDVGRRPTYGLKKLSALKNLTRFGTVSREDLIKLYSRAKVNISPSRYEGFGLSILEAMASGTPTVAFAVGGAKEVLEKIDPGLLIPAKNVDQMLKKIYSILDYKNHNGADYSKKISENFSLKKSINELEQYYYDCTQRKS